MFWKILLIIILVLFLALKVFWEILKKGKGGRISGSDVEKKTYSEALVVDVRWRKEYARGHAENAINLPLKIFKNGSDVLDDYKDKDIILYCVVDVTSRNTEKILRERGFKNLYIGDGIKQYFYGNPGFKNVIMPEMKYIARKNKDAIFFNVSLEKFLDYEINYNEEYSLAAVSKEQVIFVYGDDFSKSLLVSKELSNKGFNVVHLVEPMDKKKYNNTFYSVADFAENPTEEIGDCG